MKVIAARFLGAAATPGGGPPPGPPEVAIAGRSNVGKSALINALVGRRGLARASRTIDFKLADIDSDYRFTSTSDGKTLLTFTQSSKQKQQALVEALQKGAIRETYITQVRAANRALGLAPMPEKRAAG